MPASVATTAMESTAAKPAAAVKSMIISVETATAMESTVAAEAFMLKPAVAAKTPVYEDSFVKARAAVETSAIEAGPAIKSRPVAAMEPWARSDKSSSYEPVGSVIAVGSAGVRVVAIIAVSADWRRAYVCWSHTNADKDSLCVGERC